LGINGIDWKYLSLSSKNERAIELLREYPEKIDWEELSMNEHAIELLQENPDKISWNLIHVLL
jgi:ribosomal protein L24E